jgi:hypothetical protein
VIEVPFAADERGMLATDHDRSGTMAQCRGAAVAVATGRRSAEVGMVVVDGQLYVRAYAGHVSGWLQLALAQRRGRIRTGTIDSAVRFSRYEGPTDTIDEAYLAKYGHHGGLVTHPFRGQYVRSSGAQTAGYGALVGIP